MKNKNELVKTIVLSIIAILILVAIVFVTYGVYAKMTMEVKNPIAKIDIEDFGIIEVELYPDQAPNTVTNFITLANRGFYDGLTFHRVEKDFMIQGGDKNGDGTGSPALSDIKDVEDDTKYNIKGEFLANDYKDNKIKFEKGVIAMARGNYTSYGLYKESYNSAGSQFFIMTESLASLNGNYAAFGKVISGMETVDSISKVETAVDEDKNEETGEVTKNETTRPATDVIIESITIDTRGVEYKKPKTNEIFDLYSWYMKTYSNN